MFSLKTTNNSKFANEKLQQHFNQYIFKSEIEEYEAEKIDVPIKEFDFSDNMSCIQLFEKQMGLFSLLDEQCLFPKATDLTFVEKLTATYTKHEHYSQDRTKKIPTEFSVRHFAGKVTDLSFLFFIPPIKFDFVHSFRLTIIPKDFWIKTGTEFMMT